jgi:hypothetical protein
MIHQRLRRETLAHKAYYREDFRAEEPFVGRDRVFEDDGTVWMAIVADPVISISDVPGGRAFVLGILGSCGARVLPVLDGSVGPSGEEAR